ncbi:MAG TPA: VCBS repeat-containing protein [Silvibacterium sp.]|nr:VCBS repeat-containing protein [Silvibacterium sp.]
MLVLTFALYNPGMYAQKEQFGPSRVICNTTPCASATSFSAGDVNEDGRTDVVMGLDACLWTTSAENDCSYLYLLKQNSDGSFTPSFIQMVPPDFSTPGGPFDVKLADVNGDGHLDIIASGRNRSPNELIFLGDGKGNFQLKQDLVVRYPGTPVVQDFNGDGRPDIALLSENFLSIFLNQGDGTFAEKQVLDLGNQNWLDEAGRGRNMVAGDFKGDGKVDLAFYGLGTNLDAFNPMQMEVVLGAGDGTFKQDYIYNFSTPVYAIAAADLNHDGKTEIVASLGPTGQAGSEDRIAVLTPNLKGKLYWAWAEYGDQLPGKIEQTIGLSDLNGDGKLDIFGITTGNDLLTVMNGTGGYTFGSPFTLQDASDADFPFTAPLVKGAKPSLFYSTSEGISVLPNTTP